MKHSDSGEFCILYIEPADEKDVVFEAIGQQKKPVVILLPSSGRARLFQRPEDFSDLKHIKRQQNLAIVFVIAGNEYLRQLASRYGFPSYVSMDALSKALEESRVAVSHQRAMAKTARTRPLVPPEPVITTRKTVPLTQASQQPNVVAPPKPTSSPMHKNPSSPLHRNPSTPLPNVQPPAFVPPVPPPQPKRRSSRAVLVLLVVLSLLLLGGAGVGYYLFLYHPAPTSTSPAAPPVIGHVYFLSSEQVSENSNQGLNDQILIDLHSVPAPTSGNSYYAWLLSDNSQGDSTVIPLGRLAISQGNIHFLYSGDAQHTNLLAITSRFLITEEPTTPAPISPSPDYSTWRFYGEISQTPDPRDANHYSLLDHLRHLLASDPLLNEMELPGGLSNWLFRNTEKLQEWTVSARDRWEENPDLGFVRRQTLRTLAYLDGLSYIQPDMPPNMDVPVTPHLASVGLINVQGPDQTPPSYLTHILHHLNGLLNTPGATDDMRRKAAQIITAMSNVQQWLAQMRSDAKQIVFMSDAQLGKASSFALLNDMVDMANRAYIGSTNPETGQVQPGVMWIHDQLQSLATLNITRYTPGTYSPEIVPTKQPVSNTYRPEGAYRPGRHPQGMSLQSVAPVETPLAGVFRGITPLRGMSPQKI
jgi:hypothetical protein